MGSVAPAASISRSTGRVRTSSIRSGVSPSASSQTCPRRVAFSGPDAVTC